jgi:hypothetical protein
MLTEGSIDKGMYKHKCILCTCSHFVKHFNTISTIGSSLALYSMFMIKYHGNALFYRHLSMTLLVDCLNLCLSYCKLNSSNLIGSLAVLMRLYYLSVAGNIGHVILL